MVRGQLGGPLQNGRWCDQFSDRGGRLIVVALKFGTFGGLEPIFAVQVRIQKDVLKLGLVLLVPTAVRRGVLLLLVRNLGEK